MAGTPFDQPYRGGFVRSAHHFALTVYFEDTDTAGIVYYANYLKYMERARSDMLRAAGIDQRAAIDDGAGVYAVAEANAQRSSATTFRSSRPWLESARRALSFIKRSAAGPTYWRGR